MVLNKTSCEYGCVNSACTKRIIMKVSNGTGSSKAVDESIPAFIALALLVLLATTFLLLKSI